MNAQLDSAPSRGNSTGEVKFKQFATVLIALLENPAAVRRASNLDLAIVEGILTAVLESVTVELRRRDRGNKHE